MDDELNNFEILIKDSFKSVESEFKVLSKKGNKD